MVERNRVERGKLWKTGLIFAKGAAMRINANLEPAYLTPPPSAQRLSVRRQMSLYTGAVDHELRPPPSCGA